MLQDGLSGTERVLPAGWADSSWTPAFDWRAEYDPLHSYSYGRLWWTTDGPPLRANLAWGYGGQFIYVAPEADLVVVATTDWRGVTGDPGGPNAVERAVLDVILDTVVPGVR